MDAVQHYWEATGPGRIYAQVNPMTELWARQVRDFVASRRYQATRAAASQNTGPVLSWVRALGCWRRWRVPYCSCSHTMHI